MATMAMAATAAQLRPKPSLAMVTTAMAAMAGLLRPRPSPAMDITVMAATAVLLRPRLSPATATTVMAATAALLRLSPATATTVMAAMAVPLRLSLAMAIGGATGATASATAVLLILRPRQSPSFWVSSASAAITEALRQMQPEDVFDLTSSRPSHRPKDFDRNLIVTQDIGVRGVSSEGTLLSGYGEDWT